MTDHRVSRRRRQRQPAAVCAAAGWQLGTANLTADGTLICPVCDQHVDARRVRGGVVEVDAHPPADAVTCSCGTVHDRLDCPNCGRRIPAADALLHHVAFAETVTS